MILNVSAGSNTVESVCAEREAKIQPLKKTHDPSQFMFPMERCFMISARSVLSAFKSCSGLEKTSKISGTLFDFMLSMYECKED